MHYPAVEVDAALNEAQRLFCFLTLGLETTADWTPASTFTHMLGVFTDWIVPLRIATASGAKVRPARLVDLVALDPAWPAATGSVQRYLIEGLDMLAIYPTATDTLSVTYARAPVAMVGDTDVPEIPAEYHPRLIDYAIYRCRQGEGAQEFEKAKRYFDAFLDATQHYAQYVLKRQIDTGQRYDKLPFELEKFREEEKHG